jgi:hypothetical protein
MEITKDLKIWSREKFGHVTRQLEQLRQLDSLERDDPISNRAVILQQQEMLDMAISYFENLCSKDGLINPQEIVDLMEPAVTAQPMQSFVRSTAMRKLQMHYFRLVLSKRRVRTASQADFSNLIGLC